MSVKEVAAKKEVQNATFEYAPAITTWTRQENRTAHREHDDHRVEIERTHAFPFLFS